MAGVPAPPTGSGPGWPGGKPPSRASLAQLAYPSLARRAWRYRVGLYSVLVILVAWLMVTCILSWDVATGSALLDRVTALETRVTTLEGAAATTTRPAPQTGDAPAPVQNGQQAAPAPAQAPVQQPAPGAQSDARSGPAPELLRARALRTVALGNLGSWLSHQGRIRPFLVRLIGGTEEPATITLPPPPTAAPATAATTETNAEWAAVLLAILASNILPIFYGLLGAGAAVVRQVSQRMRDSLLAPRDIILAYVQLALGAVIGACIGLFVDPDGNAASTPGGLLGSVPLSASALCFVAGFGVEGVFQALESLIRRVFNLDQPRAAPPPPQ